MCSIHFQNHRLPRTVKPYTYNDCITQKNMRHSCITLLLNPCSRYFRNVRLPTVPSFCHRAVDVAETWSQLTNKHQLVHSSPYLLYFIFCLGYLSRLGTCKAYLRGWLNWKIPATLDPMSRACVPSSINATNQGNPFETHVMVCLQHY